MTVYFNYDIYSTVMMRLHSVLRGFQLISIRQSSLSIRMNELGKVEQNV